MSWSQLLYALPARIVLDNAKEATVAAEIIEWNHRFHLSDNAPHRHTYFEVCLVGNHGAGEFRVEDGRYPIRPGDVFFARPGMIHQIINTSDPPMELFWVGFRPEKVSRVSLLGLRFEAFRRSPIVVRGDERVASLWQSLRSVCETRDDFWELQARDLSAVLLRSLIALGSETSASGETLPESRPHDSAAMHRRTSVNAALRYIDDNLNRRLPLTEIASHLHVSPRHLTRLFCEFCGVPPATYIACARLDKAEALLLYTVKPLKEVAHEVGFDDTSHFSRVFAQAKGTPPGQFRRTAKSTARILTRYRRRAEEPAPTECRLSEETTGDLQ